VTRTGKQYFVRLWVDKDPANLNGTKRVFRTLKREDPFYVDFFPRPLEIDFPPPSPDGKEKSLLPGTTYYWVVQVLDNDGNHNDVNQVYSFVTKQRTVDITVQGLTVINDGDAGNELGEAEFRVMIVKDGIKVKEWKLGTDDDQEPITDAFYPLTGRLINLHASIPPQLGDYKVGVNAHGREFDGTSDELATNSPNPMGGYNIFEPWFIQYKTGRRGEVEDSVTQPFTSKAASVVDSDGLEQDTFAFEIHGSYWVKYV